MRRPFIFKYLILVFLILVGIVTKNIKNTLAPVPRKLDSLQGNYISHVLQGANKPSNLK